MNFLNDPPHSLKRHMISPILGGGDMQRLLGDPSVIFFFFFSGRRRTVSISQIIKETKRSAYFCKT